MGLGDVLRAGVALADTLTADFQATVQHRAWTGQDGHGKATYATAVPRACAVEMKQRQIQDSTGRLRVSSARLTFPRDIAPNGAADRIEPVDPRDRFTLPDGTTGTVVDVQGFVDKTTNRPFSTEVFLGELT